MLICNKCHRKMFIDRQYNSTMHIETFCLYCGNRKFFHPPQNTEEGLWLLKKEALRAKATISPL